MWLHVSSRVRERTARTHVHTEDSSVPMCTRMRHSAHSSTQRLTQTLTSTRTYKQQRTAQHKDTPMCTCAHTHTYDVIAEVRVMPQARGGCRRPGDMPPNNIGSGMANMAPLLYRKPCVAENQPKCSPARKAGGPKGLAVCGDDSEQSR